eukprot:485010-Pyramimonas_sp.AAC.1
MPVFLVLPANLRCNAFQRDATEFTVFLMLVQCVRVSCVRDVDVQPFWVTEEGQGEDQEGKDDERCGGD